MSWRDIASRDVADASRSRGVWVLFGLLAVLSVGYAAGHSYVGEPTFPAFVRGFAGIVGTALPLLALVVGYKSVIRERTSGSLFLTLSFPHSRRDFVVGKLVGRSVVLLVPTVVAVSLGGVVGAARYGTEGIAQFPVFLLAAALYGLAFVGLSVGLSLATDRDRWVTLGSFGGYLVFVSLWTGLHSVTMLVLHRFQGAVLSDLPDWALLFRLVGPSESYHRLVHAGFETGQAARYVAPDAPVYVDWWMGLALLVVWFALPVALGYRRFVTADL